MASNNSSLVLEFGSSSEVSSYLAVNSLALFFALLGLLLNGLAVVALAEEILKRQIRAQWIILLNISLTGLFTTLSASVLSASRLLLTYDPQDSAVWVCRLSYAAFHISSTNRTAFLAILSVAMYIIIKHGQSKVKLYPLTAAIIILWVIVVISGIPYLTPAYEYKAFRKGILVCDATFTYVAYAHISLSILLNDIPGRAISIFAVIAAAVHIKRKTVIDFSPIKQSLFKFTIVLLCINILIALTNVVGVLGFVLPMGEDVTVLVWLSLIVYAALILPAILVPALMMIIFKPLWNAVKGLLTCRRCRASTLGIISTDHTTESKDAPPILPVVELRGKC